MVKLKLKIGPKGQVIIPKKLREAYKIKENGYVIVEATDDGLIIKGQPDLKEVFSWVRERQKKLSGPIANLGDLANIYLEEEFED